jgi:hypothetical protein
MENTGIKTRTILAATLACAAAFAPVVAQAQDSMPPLVKQMYDGTWPDKTADQQLIQERLYQRGIEAYMLTLPILNTIGMRDGSEGKFGKGYNVLPVWKDRMNAKTWVPTPNCDVIYSMSYLDLKATGPLVVYAPPNVIGMFTDFWQKTITDVGAIGPDRARGGLYLLLPPDYEGQVPSGYFAFKSSTYNVFLFFRTVLKQGENGSDVRDAVALAETTRVYPLEALDRERKPMQFPNASNIRVNMMYPTDFSYWEKLKAFVDYERVAAITPEVRGVLASIGIVKGLPFTPNAAEKAALTKAVETAPKMIFAWRLAGRADHKELYYTDRQYFNAWAGVDAEWFRPSYLDVDQRDSFFQVAYSSSPGMVMGSINQGSKYPSTMRDKDGDLLDGSKFYKLHLPPGIPAKLYWAVTIYNPADGTMPETDQPFPSRNTFDRVQNADGSIDLYFGPTKPEGVNEKNWIQTLKGRAFLVTIRLYGSGTEFYDQTWKPDDVVKMK